MRKGEVMASSSIGSHISHVSRTQYSELSTQYLELSTQYSVLSTQYSVLILNTGNRRHYHGHTGLRPRTGLQQQAGRILRR